MSWRSSTARRRDAVAQSRPLPGRTQRRRQRGWQNWAAAPGPHSSTREAPGFGDHQANTTRVIRWWSCTGSSRSPPAPGGSRGWVTGSWRFTTVCAKSSTSPDLGQAMRTHCLNFRGAPKWHHTCGDLATFPMLARQFPALAAALTKARRGTRDVTRLQEEIQQLADGYVPGESDPTRLRDDLERL